MATGTSAKHTHRWTIGQVNGKPKLKGRCYGCGRTRQFKAAVGRNEIQLSPNYKDMLKSGGAW